MGRETSQIFFLLFSFSSALFFFFSLFAADKLGEKSVQTVVEKQDKP